ncbi:MAG: hypothetical protein QNJ42_21545 [Crocosphaera sp.]|nr:hypothetical protein [Crocosphaera sp.]
MNFTPIKLTIVDFLGVFLPGTIWIVLFATLRDTIILTYHHFGYILVKCPNQYPNPINKGLDILTLDNDRYGPIFYLGLALVAVILGYLNMALSTEFTEWISHLDLWIKFLFKGKKYRQNVFPYQNQFKNKTYFKFINNYMVNRFNTFGFEGNMIKEIIYNDKKNTTNEKPKDFSELDLPIYQPFESCKRFLKLHAPTLWEEVQYREGQVRLLSSLFLASIFNFILAMWNYLVIQNSSHNSIWLIISVFIMLYLAYIFRLRRLREVQDVYLSTFIVLIDQNSEKNQKS